MTGLGIQTTGPQLGSYHHRAWSEWSTWVKTKPIDWHQNAWNLIEEPSCRSVALQENSGWQNYSASHTKN